MSQSCRSYRLAVTTAIVVLLWQSGAAEAQQLRCIAVAGSPAAGVPQGALFATFDEPTLSDTAGIVLRATLAVGLGGVDFSNDVGFWRFPVEGGALLVAREGIEAPLLPGLSIVELGLPVTEGATNAIGYWARLSGPGIDPTNDRAVFADTGSSQMLWYQAGSTSFGTPAGPIASLDDYRDHPTLNAGGYPALRGVLQGGAQGVFAVDHLNADDSIVVALEGVGGNGLPAGVVYESAFSSPTRNEGGDIAFRALLRRGTGGVDASNDQIIMARHAIDGSYELMARTGWGVGHAGDSVVIDSLSEPTLTDEPRAGFRIGLRQGFGGVNSTNDSALCSRCPCGAIFLHTQRGELAPGLAGAAFDRFSLPLFSRSSRMLFGAVLRGPGVSPSNDSSVWWLNIPYEYVLAAREGQPAPGAGGALFADFQIDSPDFWMGTDDGSQLVFTGRLSDGRRGLWVFTPYRGTRLLVLEGQSVEVAAGDTRQIESLVPPASYAGVGRPTPISRGRLLAFRAVVTGGQTAVFTVELPEYTTGCPSDWDNSGATDSQDFFDFLVDFFSSIADLNNSGATDSQDFFDFLVAFFSGC